jgi:hypothetical protein
MAIDTADNDIQMVAGKSQANNVDIATREPGKGGDVEMVAEELDEGDIDMLRDEFHDGNIDADGDVEMAAGQLVNDVELAVLVVVDDEDDEMEAEEGEEREDVEITVVGALVNDDVEMEED